MGYALAKARRWWAARSLRLQLTAWYGAALLALLGLLALLVYGLLLTNLRAEAARQLASYATQAADSLTVEAGGMNFADPPSADKLLLVYSANGVLLEGSSTEYRPAAPPAWATTQANGVYDEATLPDGRWLLYAVRGGSDEHASGLLLIAGQSLEPMYATLSQVLGALALAGALVALLACAGGYLLAGRALRPVAGITQTARRIQAEGLGSRIGLSGRHDELGELAATLDAMLARLEQTSARERRFTADAAHELRAPLAVVQAETTLALTRTRSADEYRRVLGVVADEAGRMGRLVADLLVLARADEGRFKLAGRPVELTMLCQDVGQRMATLAAQHGIRLQFGLTPGITVSGDEAWLAQMLVNLVDNAIKYNRPSGWVRLSLAGSGAQAVLTIEDNGVGIQAEHLPHIFERFYRVDRARSRDDAAAGFGLGLAICAWIARAHGGHIEVSSQAEQGSCFTVYLPALRGVPPASASSQVALVKD